MTVHKSNKWRWKKFSTTNQCVKTFSNWSFLTKRNNKTITGSNKSRLILTNFDDKFSSFLALWQTRSDCLEWKQISIILKLGFQTSELKLIFEDLLLLSITSIIICCEKRFSYHELWLLRKSFEALVMDTKSWSLWIICRCSRILPSNSSARCYGDGPMEKQA